MALACTCTSCVKPVGGAVGADEMKAAVGAALKLYTAGGEGGVRDYAAGFRVAASVGHMLATNTALPA